MTSERLNIGAAITYIPGFRNIDISPVAEIRLDLNHDPLPFETGSVDLIFSYHTLEHVSNYLFALGEIHRVLRHGGRFLLGVPYLTSTELNLVNPYHKQHFTERSFDFFSLERNKGCAGEENPVLFTRAFHRFHHVGLMHLTPPPFRGFARRHLLNTVKKIDFGLIAIKDPSRPVPVTRSVSAEMRQQFQECLAARTPYDASTRNFRRADQQSLRGRIQSLRDWWRGTDE